MSTSRSQSGKQRPDPSSQEAIRIQIQALLDCVQEHLAAALGDDPLSQESVHQLRIASRKTQAALAVYGHLLPKRHANWLKRRLQDLRRAAGACRDLDVLRERFESRKNLSEKNRRKSKRIVARLSKERLEAIRPLEYLYQSLIHSGKFGKHQQSLLEPLSCKTKSTPAILPSPTLAPSPAIDDGIEAISSANWSHTRLDRLTRRFFKAGRLPLNRLSAIHSFRIQAKKLRYALEIVLDRFPTDRIREVVTLITKLQKILGELNDHAFACRQLNGLKRSSPPKQRRYLKKQIKRARQKLKLSKSQLKLVWHSRAREELKHHLKIVISPVSNAPNPQVARE
jgi:CHAD domain-containing protein